MKNIYFTIFLLIILIKTISAQGNYKKGHIVNLKGDTLSVLINDRNKNVNPKLISIKESLNSASVNYSPAQIKASITDSGDYYVSAIVHIDKNYNSPVQKADTKLSTNQHLDTVFLRLLFKSKLSLYIFTETQKEHFYVKADTGDYHELIFKKMSVLNASGDVVGTYYDSRYIQQLHMLMTPCKQLFSEIDKTQYTEKSLLSIFKKYHQCLNPLPPEYITIENSKKVSCQIMVGLDIAQIQFEGVDNFSYLPEGTFSQSKRFTIGFRAVIPMKRNKEKFNFVTEAAWRQYDTKASYNAGVYNDEYNIHFQMNYLKFNFAMQYIFVNALIKPYINFGGTLAYLINSENEKQAPYRNAQMVLPIGSPDSEVAYIHPKDFDLGYYGSLGATYKRINAEVSYERTQGFAVNELKEHISTIYILLGYQFNKLK